MDLGLAERVVIITGGSAGIGRAAALAFAAERARVLVTYYSNRERAAALVDRLCASGTDAVAARFDLAEPESFVAVAQLALERWGRIDALVNNAVDWGAASLWNMPPFESVEPADWRRVYEANFEGHYRAIQAVLPTMRARRWGRIVNISSGIAIDGYPGAGSYAAAKSALHGLTRTLAKELGPAGILTNVVMPGLTLTEAMLARVPAARRDAIAAASPIRRLLPPDEVVPAIVFLASAANTAVIGELIRASGGVT